jgi:hypothetical protein
MTEYTLSAFGFLALSGMLSLLLYGEGRAERAAMGIISAFLLISPLVTLASTVDLSSLQNIGDGSGYESDLDPSEVADRAFAEGIRMDVAEKFLINKEDIRVRTVDFDMEKMKCLRIEIFLSGAASFADYRGIEEYVTGLGMGECRVEIQLGQDN